MSNPWLTGPTPNSSAPAPSTAPLVPADAPVTGAAAPQPGVPVPDTADRLPQWRPTQPAMLWWLGVHGGAGESSLAALAACTRPARHAWPLPALPGTHSRVALVARTSWAGLTAAQRAATEWASGSLGDGLDLAGLVLIQDAPGRLPKPLRELQEVISGGVPRVWSLPWLESLRLGPIAPAAGLPRAFRDLLADLRLDPSTSSSR